MLIADNFAVALNDQFHRVVLVKHAVARFERNPSAGLRGIRMTTLSDAGSVVHYEHSMPSLSIDASDICPFAIRIFADGFHSGKRRGDFACWFMSTN
jgi:hypothetical protein